ncbi:MAG TPA: 3-hydroxyacyl-CoA dehydrogenase [Gammaproteobacteria bacterium]|nr:3-hydroxyacyl-CoA dehydrogenase [Gammaproteobacteria bacterium]
MSALSPDTPVAVIGAGTMGAGIAQVAAAAGHRVFLHDVDAAAVERAVRQIEAELDRLRDKGRIDARERNAIAARITACTQLDTFAGAGLAIEAIVEDLDAKRKLFAALEEQLSDTAILASNTSSLSITAIAAGLEHPQRVAGMHFFNPAPVMRLVEIVRGAETSADTAGTLRDTAAAWGKVPALAESTPGFIVNRVARGFYAEGLRALAEQAADASTVDAVLRECGGFRMGPFELIDLIGVDVNHAVTRSVYEAFFFDPRFRPSLVQQGLIDAGRLGRKSGHGFYRYGEGAERQAPQTAARADAPEYVIAHGSLGPAQRLVDLIDASPVSLRSGSHHDLHALDAEDVVIALTDGRSATQRAAELGKPVVLFDLAFDYMSAGRIALAPADQCSAAELDRAVGLVQALDKSVSVIDDFPGMLVMRTVAMLANEAADAVLQGVASPGDIDAAMQAGVNYPLGPLAWADRIGLEHVVATLDNLRATYGEERYRASAWLRRSLCADRSAAAGRVQRERDNG